MSDGKALYDDIGKGYNTTRQADPYLTERLYALLKVKDGAHCLDVGCGTGNYTIALAAKGLNFYGVEPSEEMLGIARSKASNVTWLKGSAEHIPAKVILFDAAISTLTIHHWNDLDKAFAEVSRVLKPGARFVIFTATPEQMDGYWLNIYFPIMLKASIVQMPGYNHIKQSLINAGFEIAGTEKYSIEPDLQDLFLYSGKHNPELYFDEKVRKGISSFANLANRDEVNEGLARLKSDIDGGNFKKLKSAYENEHGDYLFITAQKASL